MMLEWNWRKSRNIFPRENEHLVVTTFYSPGCLGQETAKEPFGSVFGLTQPGIESESPVSVANALST